MNVRVNTRDDYDTCGVSFNAVMGVDFVIKDVAEVVCTVDEAKLWAKIDGDFDDVLIRDLEAVARVMCEQYCNTSFTLRTVTATLNNSLGKIYLPYGPLQKGTDELTSAKDINDVDVDVILKGQRFKYIQSPLTEHMEVVYEAGYGSAGDALPLNYKNAVLNQIAYLYQNRGDEAAQATLSPDAKVILNLVRR